MLKADFHVHTHYSRCSNMKPQEIVKRAVYKGYDVLGVVDHDSIMGGISTKKIAGKSILVIPGEEIKTDKGEVIVLLSDGKYTKNLDEVCDRCKEMNHFLFVPHPFDFLRFRTSMLYRIKDLKHADAIETFNSRIFFDKFNLMAREFSAKNNIQQIAGSDAHTYGEIGNVEALMECEKSIDSVFDCIRENKIKFKCKKAGILPHIKTSIIKMTKI